MTFQQLRTFLWVARLGGIRKASEQMNLSQPAVSARIAALEDALRTHLLERSSRGVQLTRAGEMLRAYAEQMFFVHEEIRLHVADPGGVEGLFRIGASETIAQSWLPLFFQEISNAFPRITPELTVDISVNLRDALMGRQLDIVFLMGPISEYSVVNVDLPAFELRWYRAANFGPVDFTRTPVISYSRSTRPYRELRFELTKRYGPFVRIFSSASLSTSLHMISAGIGVGAFPCALAVESLERSKMEEFDPGWRPNALSFTASYLSEPRNMVAERSAEIAHDVASLYDRKS